MAAQNKMEYELWLRDQPSEFIKQTLGKEKAKEFIEGGVSFGPFQVMEGTETTMKILKSEGNEK